MPDVWNQEYINIVILMLSLNYRLTIWYVKHIRWRLITLLVMDELIHIFNFKVIRHLWWIVTFSWKVVPAIIWIESSCSLPWIRSLSKMDNREHLFQGLIKLFLFMMYGIYYLVFKPILPYVIGWYQITLQASLVDSTWITFRWNFMAKWYFAHCVFLLFYLDKYIILACYLRIKLT